MKRVNLLMATFLMASLGIAPSADTIELRMYPALRIDAQGSGVVVPNTSLTLMAKGDWRIWVPDHLHTGYAIDVSNSVFDEDMIKQVRIVTGTRMDGKPGAAILELNLTPEGTRRLSDFTKDHINKPVAIKYNDRWVSTPTLKNQIKDGRTIIVGLDTEDMRMIVEHFAEQEPR